MKRTDFVTQRAENQALCVVINGYWKARGFEANARAELCKVPLYFRYESWTENKIRKTKKIELAKPVFANSWEIVSDLGVEYPTSADA